jgi:hypothetical protein
VGDLHVSGNAKQRRVRRRRRDRILVAAMSSFYPKPLDMLWDRDPLYVFVRVQPTTYYQGRMDVSRLVAPP